MKCLILKMGYGSLWRLLSFGKGYLDRTVDRVISVCMCAFLKTSIPQINSLHQH